MKFHGVRHFLGSFVPAASIAFCWTAGWGGGLAASAAVNDCIYSWMLGADFGTVSIVWLFLATLFPFLISALAVSFSWRFLLLPICLGKAFVFAFVAYGVCSAFGAAGWLVCGLLLFRSWASAPFLLGFWLRYIRGGRPGPMLYLGATVLCAGLAGIDYCLISPLLGRVIVW